MLQREIKMTERPSQKRDARGWGGGTYNPMTVVFANLAKSVEIRAGQVLKKIKRC
jgi:hypothetical protein